MKLENIKTKAEIESFVDYIVGENRECEKNLLMAVTVFLKTYCPIAEQDYDHLIQILLSTKVCKQMRHPTSDFDTLMSQVESVEPEAPCLVYYDAYKSYPDGVANQAAGNLIYRLTRKNGSWPKRPLVTILKPAGEHWKPVDEWFAKSNDAPKKDEDDFNFF